MALHSVVVWDDESQRLNGSEFNAWGDKLMEIVRRKAGATLPDHKINGVYSRRNDAGNGTIFEWD